VGRITRHKRKVEPLKRFTLVHVKKFELAIGRFFGLDRQTVTKFVRRTDDR